MLEITVVVFQQSDQEPVGFVSIHLKLVTVQAQEHVGGKERNTLVSVDERVIHDERLKQRGSHFGEISIVAGLRAVQGALQ